MTAQDAPVFRGRPGESKLLDRLLDDARGGPSGFGVAPVSGVEAERELPFAGLHQLCPPFPRDDRATPALQQVALA